MCMRVSIHRGDKALRTVAKGLGRAIPAGLDAEPCYNVAPGRKLPLLASASDRPVSVQSMLWGFVPAYDVGRTPSRMLPNARIETAGTLHAFKEAFVSSRCVLPVDGFYEWTHVGKKRIPHLLESVDGEPLCLAGLWASYGTAGEAAFALLTTRPNRLVSRLHDRMPVLLSPGLAARWLEAGSVAGDLFEVLCRPAPDSWLRVRELGPFVNATANQGPRCHEDPVPDGQLDLF